MTITEHSRPAERLAYVLERARDLNRNACTAGDRIRAAQASAHADQLLAAASVDDALEAAELLGWDECDAIAVA